MILKIAGFDPSFANLGIARANLNLDDMSLVVERVSLVQTEPDKSKAVRKNSDDLRRALLLKEAIVEACEGVSFAIAEIPFGSQSARSAWTLGIAVGVMTAVTVPLIQVSPAEVKLATVGTKTASKGEMIEWVTSRHPSAEWLTRKYKGNIEMIDKNEHMADAVAAIYAGLNTNQFKQSIAMMRGLMLAA